MPTFAKLWSSHPNVTGEKALLDRKVYENQCAINLGAALIRSGVDMQGYNGALSWEKDKPRYPIRAQELATWLSSGAARLPAAVEKFGGKEAFGRVDGKKGMTGRTGIAFFQNYWGPGAQGDHIDLWNGSRLTDWRTWARINVRVGDYGLHTLGAGSDFQKAVDLVLGGDMRRSTYVILGILAGLILGTFVAYFFNTWYAGHFVKGDDDSNLLVSFLLFGFWPVSAVVDALAASWFHRRRVGGAKGET